MVCRWISVRIEVLGGIFTAAIAFWLVYRRDLSSAAVGFTIVLLGGFNRQLLMSVRIYNFLEVQANRLDFDFYHPDDKFNDSSQSRKS